MKNSKPNNPTERAKGLHKKNMHAEGYDFNALLNSDPDLSTFLLEGQKGQTRIDFSSPEAVKALNRALLKTYYGVKHWDIPPGALCPPVPGRLDYLLYMADLLHDDSWSVRTGRQRVNVLDIGTGASIIYPIIGSQAQHWNFVGSEICPSSVQWAKMLLSVNPQLKKSIDVRLQPNENQFFKNIVRKQEKFTFSICNPPFYASAGEAAAANALKWKKLGLSEKSFGRNYGGHSGELWVKGGEEAFVRQMIAESRAFVHQFEWFSSLLSKKKTAVILRDEIVNSKDMKARLILMRHGQKVLSVLVWKMKEEYRSSMMTKKRN